MKIFNPPIWLKQSRLINFNGDANNL